MGIVGVTMPLLSTLAALVIIVHSAEEELSRGVERDVYYDVRPAILDTGTHDRRWRVPRKDPTWTQPETEPLMQSTPTDIWSDSPEVPRRRRPGRKRKRPPMERQHFEDDKVDNAEVIAPDDTHTMPVLPRYRDSDEPLRYRDTQYAQGDTNIIRRRRKPDGRRNRWADDMMEIELPVRRRGQRLKRPQRPELAEFNEFIPREPETYEPIYKDNDDEEVRYEDGESPTSSTPELREQEHPNLDTNRYDDSDEKRTNSFFRPAEFDETESRIQETVYHRPIKPKTKDDAKADVSLSEFSEELTHPVMNPIEEKITLKEKIEEKAPGFKHIHADPHPIDPVSLKDILKRSNGTSLSEILQQRNLSLSDLLRGKEDAISALKTDELVEKHERQGTKVESADVENNETAQKDVQKNIETKIHNNAEIAQEHTVKEPDLELQSSGRDGQPQGVVSVEENENKPKIATKRRFPNVRRKLRMRTPAMIGVHKSPLSRDLMANTARKYHHSRNMTKSKEWKSILPLMNTSDSSEEKNKNNVATEPPTTTTSAPEETTILHNSQYNNPTTVTIDPEVIATITNKPDNDNDNSEKETTTALLIKETTVSETIMTTGKPKVSRLKPPASRVGLRRQAYNNRMKRKRMKQKISTTESPGDADGGEDAIDFLGMPNMVSSSEFIASTQTPQITNGDNQDVDFTTLDDFFTTQKPKVEQKEKLPVSGPRYTRNSTIPAFRTEPTPAPTLFRYSSTTEETAKFEIEEILNDTRTSARLSKILMERNMTLNELVEHRERGSSHVHLADIFHNASKEPNPPEPFLSKSLIEPISKETYPLRAILEANLHDTAAKATTIEPSIGQSPHVNIPVAMNFGNNVNENGETMGIMSLFNKLTGNDITSVENTSTGKDSEGTPYITTIFTVNHTQISNTSRESKAMKEEKNNLNNDVVGLGHLLELMRKGRKNSSHDAISNDPILDTGNKVLVEDSNGDDVIVFEDLQRLKDLEINIGSKDNIDVNSYETDPANILDTPNRTKSVTVATASIVGLAMILFLLTYAAIKWRQQRSALRNKQNFTTERIPTPVFEIRKGHKNNCSTRSISPMLNSNIYTMNTLDSSNGKESPDYMWDSLRKPFQ